MSRRGARRAQPTYRRVLVLLLGVGLLAAAFELLGSYGADDTPAVPLDVLAADTTGGALAGVRLRVYASKGSLTEPVYECTTDETGVGTVPAEWTSEEVFCVAITPDGTVSQGYARKGEAELRIEIGKPSKILGRSIDERGIPVAAAVVEASLVARGPILSSARTDSEGQFELDSIADSLPFLYLRVRAPGYADGELDWNRQRGGPLEFELVATEPLRLRILDPDGKPIMGLRAKLGGRPGVALVSDVDGRLRFDGLDPKKVYDVQLEDLDLTYRRRGLAPTAAEHELRLERPATLTGRVMAASGYGLAEVEVRHRHGPRAWVRAKTDRSGRFELGDLPSGEVEILYETPSGKIGVEKVMIEEGQLLDGYVIRVPG